MIEDPEIAWKSAVFSEVQRNGAHGQSIRTARYRFTEWTPLDGEDAAEFELYDLERDPREYDNLAAVPEQQGNRYRLAKMLRAGWRAAMPGSAMASPTGESE